MSSSQLLPRMKRELEILERDPMPGIICYPVDDNLLHFCAQIKGPNDTPYEDGLFKVDVQIPLRYPMEPPKMQFITPIYHPNVDDAGRICLDLLKMPPKGSWKPSLNISTTLTSLSVLMADPNPDDPLLVEIASEFKENKSLFLQKARQATLKHAVEYKNAPNTEDSAKECEQTSTSFSASNASVLSSLPDIQQEYTARSLEAEIVQDIQQESATQPEKAQNIQQESATHPEKAQNIQQESATQPEKAQDIQQESATHPEKAQDIQQESVTRSLLTKTAQDTQQEFSTQSLQNKIVPQEAAKDAFPKNKTEESSNLHIITQKKEKKKVLSLSKANSNKIGKKAPLEQSSNKPINAPTVSTSIKTVTLHLNGSKSLQEEVKQVEKRRPFGDITNKSINVPPVNNNQVTTNQTQVAEKNLLSNKAERKRNLLRKNPNGAKKQKI